ncbi:hypothetical protein CROQUDRAFT_42908, partial [Cronartium quercuum f. sp. fusiforme G11]
MKLSLEQCTCPACLVNTITDEEGNMIPGTWGICRTQRKHQRKMAAKLENTPILEALANDFHTKASIK